MDFTASRMPILIEKGGASVIEIHHLVKKYGDLIAVNDLNFTMKPGKIYGLLGKNGAGKTTTMNIITGYIGATSGDVVINGHNILEEPELAKKQIGYLPEIPPLYQDMTVWEYLDFAAELKGIGKKERESQVDQVMADVKIEDMKARLIRNLSKGYKQRVGLAQALLGYPPILILDEPTVGLDPKQMIEMRQLIKKLGEKHTVILSSHILSEVSVVCDYVFIISEGKIVASDTVERLTRRLGTEQSLQLTCKGDIALAEKILKELPDVSEIGVAKNTTDDMFYMELRGKSGEDIRESVSMALATQGIVILEMKTRTQSLEDIFIELTEETPEEEPENEPEAVKEVIEEEEADQCEPSGKEN